MTFLSFPGIIVQDHSSAPSARSIVFSCSTSSAPHSFLSLAGGGCHRVWAAGFIVLSSRWSLAGRGCAGKGIPRETGMSSSMVSADSAPPAAAGSSKAQSCETSPRVSQEVETPRQGQGSHQQAASLAWTWPWRSSGRGQVWETHDLKAVLRF